MMRCSILCMVSPQNIEAAQNLSVITAWRTTGSQYLLSYKTESSKCRTARVHTTLP